MFMLIDMNIRWSTYYETMASLAGKIMRAFAMALQLDQDDYFERFVDHHASALRYAALWMSL
jgi:isopenicillin N synthase-like dioxygenase